MTLSYATPGAWILYWIVEDNSQWATTYTGPIDVSRTMTIAAYVYPLGNDAAIGAYVITGGSGL